MYPYTSYAKNVHIPEYYCSLGKREPTLKRAPTPHFWPNFLYRFKVCLNQCPLWSELHMEFWETNPQALCISEVRNFLLHFTGTFT